MDLGRLDAIALDGARVAEVAAPQGREAARAAARAAIRELAARIRGLEADAVRVTARCPDCGGDHGRPEILLPADVRPLYASVTHPDGRTLVAVGELPLGLDAEPADEPPQLPPQIPAQPPPERLAAVAELLGVSPGTALLTWTRVEAVLKADGRGLRIDPAEVRAAAGAHPAALDGPGPAELELRGARYLVRQVPMPGLVVSLATAAPSPAAAPR